MERKDAAAAYKTALQLAGNRNDRVRKAHYAGPPKKAAAKPKAPTKPKASAKPKTGKGKGKATPKAE